MTQSSYTCPNDQRNIITIRYFLTTNCTTTTNGQLEKEDHSGSITLWEYDDYGFPIKKTQVTDTDDPDVVTTFSYNKQGQCNRITTSDAIQENDFDVMGNKYHSFSRSLSGTLLSESYVGYNLNNEPIWTRSANEKNLGRIDTHSSGNLKSASQTLNPSNKTAYSIYEYDTRGNLIHEVDPNGNCTYRDYDPIGRVLRETKQGLTTTYTYEAGGLIESVKSPAGALTVRHYTTNGLPKEEIYPDGTSSTIAL